MTEVLKRGPGRPPKTDNVVAEGATYAANVLPPPNVVGMGGAVAEDVVANVVAAPAPEAPKPAKFVEVRIMRKYCPEFFVEEDGSLRKNVGKDGILEYIIPERGVLTLDDGT